jgi:hypothetical protein
MFVVPSVTNKYSKSAYSMRNVYFFVLSRRPETRTFASLYFFKSCHKIISLITDTDIGLIFQHYGQKLSKGYPGLQSLSQIDTQGDRYETI